MNADDLFKWLEEECCDLRCVSGELADTGDYDVRWEVHAHYQNDETRAIGFGSTPKAAVFDATLDPDDPRRSDYVPLKYREDCNCGPFSEDDDISNLMGG